MLCNFCSKLKQICQNFYAAVEATEDQQNHDEIDLDEMDHALRQHLHDGWLFLNEICNLVRMHLTGSNIRRERIILNILEHFYLFFDEVILDIEMKRQAIQREP